MKLSLAFYTSLRKIGKGEEQLAMKTKPRTVLFSAGTVLKKENPPTEVRVGGTPIRNACIWDVYLRLFNHFIIVFAHFADLSLDFGEVFHG